MDDTDLIYKSLGLDAEGIGLQMMSLAAVFNIVVAGIMGFLVLLVYLASSSRDKRDSNLLTVIPVLSVLIAVIMRVDSSHMVIFFGIFGILSIIRFRSDLTDQRGITFILFAVIEGVLVGFNSYLLAFVTCVMVGGFILAFRKLRPQPAQYRFIARAPRIQPAGREILENMLREKGIDFEFTVQNCSTELASKSGTWEEKQKIEFTLFVRSERHLMDQVPAMAERMRKANMEMELKKSD